MNWIQLSMAGIRQHEKPLAMGACAVFVLLFCWQLVSIWLPQTPEAAHNALEKPVRARPDLSSTALVFQHSLFGEFAGGGLDASDIASSTLDVTIEGIIYSANQKAALVSLRGADGQVKTYAVGDKLPVGAEIKKIRRDSIILEYRGKLESLSLPISELRFGKPAKPLFEEEE